MTELLARHLFLVLDVWSTCGLIHLYIDERVPIHYLEAYPDPPPLAVGQFLREHVTPTGYVLPDDPLAGEMTDEGMIRIPLVRCVA